MRFAPFLLVIVLALPHVASSAHAQSSAGQTGYEWENVLHVLGEEGLEPEPSPAGKRIRFIRIHRDDVFIRREFWPLWFNVFHGRTRERVVSRELLFHESEAYDEELVEESARNLVDLGIFSLVRIVPVRVGAADEVGIFVYTRDLWSLRFEQDFSITGSEFDFLFLQIVERNLLGRHKYAAVNYTLYPDQFRFGTFFEDPRFLGESIRLTPSGHISLNRETNELEGGLARLQVQRPFYDLQQRFGFEIDGRYEHEVARALQYGDVATYDIPETAEQEAIPRAYEATLGAVSLAGHYRIGRQVKHTFSLGLDYRESSYEAAAETHLEPDQVAAFERDVLPTSRREVGPTAFYSIFTPRYVSFQNLGGFGRVETVRAGPVFEVGARVPIDAFGSDHDALILSSGLGYVLASEAATGLLDFKAEAVGRVQEGEIQDQTFKLRLRGATGVFGNFGRFVGRVRWEGRRNDSANTVVSLGGSNGLRGFPSQYLQETSANLFNANIELRTLPIAIQSLHVGFFFFIDWGEVYQSIDEFELHQGAGVGVRVLGTQFNRYPFTAQVGFHGEADSRGVIFSVAAGQTVHLTAAEDLLDPQQD